MIYKKNLQYTVCSLSWSRLTMVEGITWQQTSQLINFMALRISVVLLLRVVVGSLNGPHCAVICNLIVFSLSL